MFDLAPVPLPDLTGRTILVTGAGRGIGATLVGQLAEAGATVYAGMRDSAPGRPGAGVIRLELDVTCADSTDSAARRITADGGRLDALVNNAGIITPIAPLTSLAAGDLRPAFEVNALGMYRMTLAVLPLLRESGGVVVNAGTGAATTPMAGWTAYCASKAAMRMLTLMLAKELAETGIRFFLLGIPPTDTDMQARIRESGINPISRIPREDLVAPAVPASAMAWLCSAAARRLQSVELDVRDDLFRALSRGEAPASAPAAG